MLNAEVFSVPAGWRIRCRWCRKTTTVHSALAADQYMDGHKCTADEARRSTRYEATRMLAAMTPDDLDTVRARTADLVDADRSWTDPRTRKDAS